jgi:hypothetical protein
MTSPRRGCSTARTTPVAVLLVALAFIAGCAGRPAPPAGHPAAPRTDAQAMDLAERMLLADCMREAGFDYHAGGPVPEHPELGYVLTDAGWARAHGYGSDLERQAAQASRDDPGERYFHSLTPSRQAAALAAMNGETPEGLQVTAPDGVTMSRNPDSCESQAQQHLYGDLAAWFQAQVTMDMVRAQRTSAVLTDAAYHTAAAKWSTCMARDGYRYPDPQRLHSGLPDARHPLPRAREVALAVSEARCATSTGLAAVAKRLDHHYDTVLRAKYPSAASTYDTLRRDAVPRAWAIVRAS